MYAKLAGNDLTAFFSLSYPDFSIPAGQTTFLSGPSGCGKSTLLKLLNGTLTPLSGEIFLDGQNIALLDPIALRRRVLLAEQNVYLFRSTIGDNFRLFHQYRKTEPPDKAVCLHLLELCGLSFTLDESCNTLSGGERQRVFLALALSMAPEVLLLDEPTSALDSALAHQVLKNIIQHSHDHHQTLLIISHDPALQDTYADAVIRLEGHP